MPAILDIWEEGDREYSEETTSKGPRFTHSQFFGVEVAEGDEEIDIKSRIMADSRLPSRLTLCPWDVLCICRRRRIKQDGELPRLFHVTIEYSNQPLDGGDDKPDQNEDNPLNQPPEVSWDSEEVQEALLKDLDGKPIVNSAYQRLAQTVVAIRRRRQITIVKNQATYDDAIAEAFEGCTNSSPYLNKPTGTVWCKKIAAIRQFQSNIFYYKVTYVFLYDSLGWKARVVDVGTAELVNGKYVSIKDNTGTPVTQDVLLDGHGAKAAGDPPTPYIFEFRDKNEADFNDLGI